MSAASPNGGEMFDVKRLRRLAELMNEQDLSEIDLSQGDVRVRLRRRSETVFASAEVRPAAPASAAMHAAPPAPSAAATPAADNLHVIRSPMVGTFYTSSSPESPPFVKVGDHVGPDSTVCIVEAMKVFNEIPAEVSGKIVAVLVGNGEPVEFGQPLFKVDQAG